MPAAPDTLSLVADVGGTNTRVALAKGAHLLPDTVRRFRNADHSALDTVLEAYLDAEGGVDCRGAAVAVAGPVRDGVGHLTNLDWSMDKATLARVTIAETVAVLNDMQAAGHALGFVDPANVRTVIEGPEAGPHAAKLVVNVGTGFNAAPVFEAEQGRLVTPSECGHSGLPLRTEEDLRLSQYVAAAHGFPSIEDVLSGRGLERVYAWLGEEAGEPRELGAAAIMAALERGDDPRAEATAAIFVRHMGAVAGDLALIHLPFGGVHLVGGVARAFGPHLARFGFEAAFKDKGRFSEFMENFPVRLVEDDFAALVGLASHLARLKGEIGATPAD